MVASVDKQTEGENPFLAMDTESIGASGTGFSNPFRVAKGSDHSVEWLVTDATDADANFDLVLQFRHNDGTWFDNTCGNTLTGSTSVRGVEDVKLPFWSRDCRFKVTNNDNDSADFTLFFHRSGSRFHNR